MERKALGLSPLRELATSPPQADHVLVVFFFIHGRPGGCVKAPRHHLISCHNTSNVSFGMTLNIVYEYMRILKALRIKGK